MPKVNYSLAQLYGEFHTKSLQSEFEPEDGGKIAHYFLRWVNTSDEPGLWSDRLRGTILGPLKSLLLSR